MNPAMSHGLRFGVSAVPCGRPPGFGEGWDSVCVGIVLPILTGCCGPPHLDEREDCGDEHRTDQPGRRAQRSGHDDVRARQPRRLAEDIGEDDDDKCGRKNLTIGEELKYMVLRCQSPQAASSRDSTSPQGRMTVAPARSNTLTLRCCIAPRKPMSTAKTTAWA